MDRAATQITVIMDRRTAKEVIAPSFFLAK